MTSRNFTDDDVREVVRLHNQGWGYRAICRRLNDAGVLCTEASVRDILRGKTYTRITGGRLRRGKRPKDQLACYGGGA